MVLLDSLTPREHDVFRAVLTGAMNKQIAGHLGISEKTVKIHRAQLMLKLRAKTIVDLIAIASLCSVSADPILRR
jgi:FixJ family two-component response regulator